MADSGSSGLRITITTLMALIFAIAPLPELVNQAKPPLLLLLVIYWSLSAPRIAGLMFAWMCGFAIDVVQGPLFGQHAIAYLLIAYLTHKLQLRMRLYPIYHQTFTVFWLLALYEFIVFWIDGIIGPAVTDWMRWTPVVTGALLWPLLVGILDSWSRARR
ncbi:rod shape-determining protein MreD [Povalibacter sp.]|uniref:rod shape-determining protein MreD n=1 Tax=Povalibacter sp. TaxID=1962978 RepID=UPI002F3F344B